MQFQLHPKLRFRIDDATNKQRKRKYVFVTEVAERLKWMRRIDSFRMDRSKGQQFSLYVLTQCKGGLVTVWSHVRGNSLF